ncbi:hypothetical protein MY10362_009003 [Beauveria mimosiformis]
MAESWPAPDLRTGPANPTPKTAAGEDAGNFATSELRDQKQANPISS